MPIIHLPRRSPTWKPGLGAQLNAGHPLAAGLLGSWLFNEGGGGTVNSPVGSGATLTSGSSTNGIWEPGQNGTGMKFDGSGAGYLDAGNATGIQNLGAMSIACRFRLDGFGGGNLGRIADKKAAGNGWTLIVDGGNTWLGFIRNYTASVTFSTPTGSLATGKWYTAVVAHDGTTANPKIWINGVAQTVTASSTPSGALLADSANKLTLGNRVDGIRTFQGHLEFLHLSNRQLSAAEAGLFYTEPYALAQAPATRRYFAVPAAGGTPATHFLTLLGCGS